MRFATSNSENIKKYYAVKNKQTNKKLPNDTVLTKLQICSNFHYLFSYLTQDFIFNCIEQLWLQVTNSGKFSFHFYSITNIF